MTIQDQDGKRRLREDPLLARLVGRLAEAYTPERIYLFGSKARGEGGPDSDYDLLVVVGASGEPPYRRAQRAQEVLWGIWAAADVLVLTRDEFEAGRGVPASFPATVLAEGRCLYGA